MQQIQITMKGYVGKMVNNMLCGKWHTTKWYFLRGSFELYRLWWGAGGSYWTYVDILGSSVLASWIKLRLLCIYICSSLKFPEY